LVVTSPAGSAAAAADAPLDEAWRDRLDGLLDLGRAAGADLVEVFLERTDSLSVSAEQDRITSVTPSFGMGAGLRVFLGQRDGFVSTNDLSDRGLRLALEQALGMLGLQVQPLATMTFQGLGGLRQYASGKHDWLQRSPGLAEVTATLLQGTDHLEAIGANRAGRTQNCDALHGE